MIGALLGRCTRRWRDETGSATVEFVLIFPVILTMIIMTLEMGFINLRQVMLERGLDIAVREVRLGTGTAPDHDQIKDLVCQNARIMQDCSTKLRLEMVTSDPRAFTPLSGPADCTDAAEPTKPVRSFVPGQANQVVMMRACLKYQPFAPQALLGSLLEKDTSGDTALIAVTAFVQEPL